MLESAIDLASPSGWLPIVFALVRALSMLAYVILDGYDLGVGALLDSADTVQQKDTMIASIGPFWDANETWLVLGVGVLLVGFPMAHGVILGALYLPVALMLVALSLRGVAFDFRVKAKDHHRPLWDKAFYIGSILASWSQGFMLGQLITGFNQDLSGYLFSALIGLCLVFAYLLLGAAWLIIKTEGGGVDEIRVHSIHQATEHISGCGAQHGEDGQGDDQPHDGVGQREAEGDPARTEQDGQ